MAITPRMTASAVSARSIRPSQRGDLGIEMGQFAPEAAGRDGR